MNILLMGFNLADVLADLLSTLGTSVGTPL